MTQTVSDRRAAPDDVPAQAERSTWLLVLPWELKEPGGVSQVVQNLFDATARKLGHRSLLLVNTWDHNDLEFAEVDGRRTVRTTVRSPLGEQRPLRHLMSFLLRLPASVLRLRHLIRTERITRINIHYPGLDALVWLLASRLSGSRPDVVLSFHGSDLREATLSGRLGRLLWSWLLRSVDDITACSQRLRNSVVEAFPAAWRARAVLNGVDPARIAALAETEPSLQLPQRFVLSLATIEHKKGLDTLMRAFARLAQPSPASHAAGAFEDLHVVIAGRVAEPGYFEQLQAMRAALPCAARIVFLPDLPHEQAMRVLARAQALVLASRQEPFGIVVLEAGVLGVPVLATDVCGVVGLLAPERDLLAVPSEDDQSMAEGLARLLADRERSQRLARSLQERVRAEFTWDRVIAQYESPGRPAAAARRSSLKAAE